MMLEAPAEGLVRLSVPSLILTDPASEVAFSIRVGPTEALPRNSFIRIRGLPPTAALSQGHAIAPGAWAVPVAALDGLRIVVPTGLTGQFDVSVTLGTVDGAPSAEARTSLVVAPTRLGSREPPPPPEPPQPPAEPLVPQKPPARQPAETRPPPAPILPAIPKAAPAISAPLPSVPPPAPPQTVAAVPAAPPPTPPPASATPPPAPPVDERATTLLMRGKAMMFEGNVAAARLFFTRAAEAGLAEGALAMGGTYDENELRRINTQGVRPEPREARKWYEQAARLGSAEAAVRLRRLPPQ
jgi:hypothetical protein